MLEFVCDRVRSSGVKRVKILKFRNNFYSITKNEATNLLFKKMTHEVNRGRSRAKIQKKVKNHDLK